MNALVISAPPTNGDRQPAITDPFEQLRTALDERCRLRALLKNVREAHMPTPGFLADVRLMPGQTELLDGLTCPDVTQWKQELEEVEMQIWWLCLQVSNDLLSACFGNSGGVDGVIG